MIYGIGTDIVAIKRLQAFGSAMATRRRERLLAPQEYAAFDAASDKGRFLAKRLPPEAQQGVGHGYPGTSDAERHRRHHDELGKPVINCCGELENCSKTGA